IYLWQATSPPRRRSGHLDSRRERRYRHRPESRRAAMTQAEKTRFAVFRAKDARTEADGQFMEYAGVTPVIAEGARKTMEAGPDGGHDLKLLFSIPGFSLAYVWFKSGFPLP